MNNRKFAALVLAGGLSSRMKQFKPLLPLGKTTVLDHVLSTFKDTGMDVFLVAGYRHEEIETCVKNRDVSLVYNPDFEQGMFSSVQAGARQLGSKYRAFFLLPVDIPLVRASMIKKLIDSGNKHPEHIIYPVFEGKRGHPPLIPTSLIPGILAWKHEGGLKTFLKLSENIAIEVPANDDSILFDIDTPEDYQELQRRYRDDVPSSTAINDSTP